MPKIEISKLLKKDRAEVYSILKNMEEFPKFMKSVKKLQVIERQGSRLVTSWEVEVDGAIVIWQEENIFDDSSMSMEFKMLQGDYKSYDGKWQLEDCDGGTKLSLCANFDWGIPAFEKFVGSILEKKARTLLKGMLRAMEKK